MNKVIEGKIDSLSTRVFPDRAAMGQAASADIADAIRALQQKQRQVRMVFAAAPSQNEVLAALARAPGIDWSRVSAFHMDEYVGLAPGAPQGFALFLTGHLFKAVAPGEVNLIRSVAEEQAEAECERYAALFRAAPIDLICLGIGENGHIAFNDPPVADFSDPLTIKMVELDNECRQQQVNDGCFPDLSSVPRHALTLTIPALMSGKRLFCVVPGRTKRNAVRRLLTGGIATDCPASILRRHPDCTLYLDPDSYGIPG